MNNEVATKIKTTKTADNKAFHVWSDGGVSQAFGVYWRGTRKLPVDLALKVADEVRLFDAVEVPALLTAAKRLNARKGSFSIQDLRSLAAKLAA